MIVSRAKTAEPIEMLLGMRNLMGPESIISWCYLVNTIEPSVLGGDAAFYQITH